MEVTKDNARVLKDILMLYCEAFGQEINWCKSKLFFSANATKECKIGIRDILQSSMTGSPKKYLSLPTIQGKSKCEALHFVRDKIVNKLQG